MVKVRYCQPWICAFAAGICVGVLFMNFFPNARMMDVLISRNESSSSSSQTGLTVAQELAKRMRILCLVMTTPDHHQSRAVHVQATWGKRCTKLLFISEKNDSSLPIIYVNVTSGRSFLTVKHRLGWDYVFRHHFDDADWFFKADDDAYVVMENLRYLLSAHSTADPIYFGHHFKAIVKPDGYFSGGSGYVLSKEAFRRFGTRSPGVYREEVQSADDDVEMGLAMQKLGVKAADSRDSSGLIRFYTDKPEDFIVGPIPQWLFRYDKYTPKKGIDAVSRSAIAFHHLTVQHMYNMEYFIYRLQPFGLHERNTTNTIEN